MSVFNNSLRCYSLKHTYASANALNISFGFLLYNSTIPSLAHVCVSLSRAHTHTHTHRVPPVRLCWCQAEHCMSNYREPWADRSPLHSQICLLLLSKAAALSSIIFICHPTHTCTQHQ